MSGRFPNLLVVGSGALWNKEEDTSKDTRRWSGARADGGPAGDGSPAVNPARLDGDVPTFNTVQKDYQKFHKKEPMASEDMAMEQLSAAGACWWVPTSPLTEPPDDFNHFP